MPRWKELKRWMGLLWKEKITGLSIILIAQISSTVFLFQFQQIFFDMQPATISGQ